MSKVTLIGAGLVGPLAGLYLKEQGCQVEIYEKRSDLRIRQNYSVGEGRSINLAISVRGLHALAHFGLEKEVLKFAIPMKGRILHSREGQLAFQSYGKDDKDAINSLSRAWLNGFLLDQAERAGISEIHFNKDLAGINFDKRELAFADGSSATYQLLVGTDGSASVIRSQMLNRGDTRVTSDELSHSYKEFVMYPKGSGSSAEPGLHQMEKHALHIWPRGRYMLIALPNFDGSFTCTLFLPSEGDNSFDVLKSHRPVENFFEREFPDFVKMVPDFSKQFFEHPTGKMFTVKTEHWAPPTRSKEVLLIGDAAHAIVPFFGQGMNCGFEDCVELAREWRDSIENGFSVYYTQRRRDTDAIADMAIENFVEMSDKVADPKFQFEKQVEKVLQEKFPDQYISRYSLVSFSRVPYSVALKVGKIQKNILGELCRGKNSIEEVSWDLGRTLINDQLNKVMQEEVLNREC